ncbi:TPA: 6,7-dimethyl-8-ribityllumazine synthase, partial [Candidatus Woesearchaeota archaeon]|nr:6,7-dimethyl-8-ribityllumazine synthase [Candidatus Woesearchaeota archaeon]
TPYAVQLMLRKKGVDAVAVIGAVVKGETDHDVLITTVAAERLAVLSLKFGKPVALGIIGPNATERQAQARAEEYAERAVRTALALGKMNV